MATVVERYQAATDYVKRAVHSVETSVGWASVVPAILATEIYANQLKVETTRRDLAAVEDRWYRATSDLERERIAREAELLADRVEENLPGAPSDRTRTNLYPGEQSHTTPSTSYVGHAGDEVHEALSWLKDKADAVAYEAKSIGRLVLVGGGVLLGIKAFRYLREREPRKPTRDPGRALNRSLERAANATAQVRS